MTKEVNYKDLHKFNYGMCLRGDKLQFLGENRGGMGLVKKYFAYDNSVHSVMAYINSLDINQLSSLSEDDIKCIIDKNWSSDGYCNVQEEQSYKQKLEDIFTRYLSDPKDLGVENLLINKFIHLKINTKTNMKVKVDKVHELNDGKIEIIDYKSGRYVNGKMNFSNNIQLPLYLLAVKKRIGIHVDQISYYYLVYNAKLTHLVTSRDIADAEKILVEYLGLEQKNAKLKCVFNSYCTSNCIFYEVCSKGHKSR